ncbi:phage integrase family protein [Rhodobacter sp. JA431]|nr:phage integrase family protein [Rhodobacter sp. JA431]
MRRRAEFWRERIRNAVPTSREIVIAQMKEEASEERNPYDLDDPEGIRLGELFVDIAMGEYIPLHDHIEAFLREKAKSAKPKTIELYRTSLQRFADFFETSSDVTIDFVRRWVQMLREENVADNTLQRMFSAVRGYWRYLQDEGIMRASEDPFAGVLRVSERGRNRPGKAKHYRPFETSDVVRLLRAAEERRDEQLANLIQLGMWTGCRIESLCSLRVEDVTDRSLKVNDKTEAGEREVPIHPALYPLITRLCAESQDGYVLGGLTKDKFGNPISALGGYDSANRQHIFHRIVQKTVVALGEVSLARSTFPALGA